MFINDDVIHVVDRIQNRPPGQGTAGEGLGQSGLALEGHLDKVPTSPSLSNLGRIGVNRTLESVERLRKIHSPRLLGTCFVHSHSLSRVRHDMCTPIPSAKHGVSLMLTRQLRGDGG